MSDSPKKPSDWPKCWERTDASEQADRFANECLDACDGGIDFDALETIAKRFDVAIAQARRDALIEAAEAYDRYVWETDEPDGPCAWLRARAAQGAGVNPADSPPTNTDSTGATTTEVVQSSPKMLPHPTD